MVSWRFSKKSHKAKAAAAPPAAVKAKETAPDHKVAKDKVIKHDARNRSLNNTNTGANGRNDVTASPMIGDDEPLSPQELSSIEVANESFIRGGNGDNVNSFYKFMGTNPLDDTEYIMRLNSDPQPTMRNNRKSVMSLSNLLANSSSKSHATHGTKTVDGDDGEEDRKRSKQVKREKSAKSLKVDTSNSDSQSISAASMKSKRKSIFGLFKKDAMAPPPPTPAMNFATSSSDSSGKASVENSQTDPKTNGESSSALKPEHDTKNEISTANSEEHRPNSPISNETLIFERNVEEHLLSRNKSVSSLFSKGTKPELTKSRNSSFSLQNKAIPAHYRVDDYVSPALDSTVNDEVARSPTSSEINLLNKQSRRPSIIETSLNNFLDKSIQKVSSNNSLANNSFDISGAPPLPNLSPKRSSLYVGISPYPRRKSSTPSIPLMAAAAATGNAHNNGTGNGSSENVKFTSYAELLDSEAEEFDFEGPISQKKSEKFFDAQEENLDKLVKA